MISLKRMDKLICFLEKATVITDDPYMTQYQKDVRIAELMTIMERRYNIPMLRNEQWEKDNSYVISVYRTISNMRKL